MRRSVVPIVVGVLLLMISGLWGLAAPAHVLRGYLIGFLGCLSLALGSLGLLMMHHLTGGAWGMALRRPFEAAAMTLPGIAVAGLPLALGARLVFPWANGEAVAHSALLQHRAPLFAPPMVLARMSLFLLLWSGLAWRLRRLSLEHDRSGNPRAAAAARAISTPGLVLYFFTMSLAAVDLIASREVDC